jgi:hypothetical protein
VSGRGDPWTRVKMAWGESEVTAASLSPRRPHRAGARTPPMTL